ncbi:hypothetical protein HDV06_004593 [Boothiomyces sp. JEL0866]|nr:hypothetical protein HDV06_004593 [Boothiomyces sp. JEL0866]
MLTHTDRRFSIAPEEENAETIGELVVNFIEVLESQGQKGQTAIQNISSLIDQTNAKQSFYIERAKQSIRQINEKVEEQVMEVGNLEKQLQEITAQDTIGKIHQEIQEKKKLISEHKQSITELSLKKERLELELKDVLASEEDKISKETLQLGIYQKLGLDLIDYDSATGKYKKAVAKCPERNRIQRIEFDEQLSDFYYTNTLWDLLTPN